MVRTVMLGLTLAAGLAPPAFAQAAAPTVRAMQPSCEAYLADTPPADTLLIRGAGECVGTIIGIGLVMRFNCMTLEDGTASPHPAVIAAVPDTRGELVQAWLDWARAHPERADTEFSVSISLAFQEAFPCSS